MSLFVMISETDNVTSFRPSVGGIQLDSTKIETYTYDSDVPTHATEDGFSVSDNVHLSPVEIQISAVVVPTVFGDLRDAGYLETVRNDLLLIRDNKEPTILITGFDTFDSVILKTAVFKRTPENVNSLEVDLTFRQIKLADVKKVKVKTTKPKAKKTVAFKNAGPVIKVDPVAGNTVSIPNRIVSIDDLM